MVTQNSPEAGLLARIGSKYIGSRFASHAAVARQRNSDSEGPRRMPEAVVTRHEVEQ